MYRDFKLRDVWSLYESCVSGIKILPPGSPHKVKKGKVLVYSRVHVTGKMHESFLLFAVSGALVKKLGWNSGRGKFTFEVEAMPTGASLRLHRARSDSVSFISPGCFRGSSTYLLHIRSAMLFKKKLLPNLLLPEADFIIDRKALIIRLPRWDSTK